MIRWIFALSTICLPTSKEPTRSDNIRRTIDNSIKVKDFFKLYLRDDDKELKLLSLSLSLSLSLREYRSINKKFHKTSKIKNREIMFVKSYLSRYDVAPGAEQVCRTSNARRWQTARAWPRAAQHYLFAIQQLIRNLVKLRQRFVHIKMLAGISICIVAHLLIFLVWHFKYLLNGLLELFLATNTH